jgi:hypothetical protein
MAKVLKSFKERIKRKQNTPFSNEILQRTEQCNPHIQKETNKQTKKSTTTQNFITNILREIRIRQYKSNIQRIEKFLEIKTMIAKILKFREEFETTLIPDQKKKTKKTKRHNAQNVEDRENRKIPENLSNWNLRK